MCTFRFWNSTNLFLLLFCLNIFTEALLEHSENFCSGSIIYRGWQFLTQRALLNYTQSMRLRDHCKGHKMNLWDVGEQWTEDFGIQDMDWRVIKKKIKKKKTLLSWKIWVRCYTAPVERLQFSDWKFSQQ